MVRHQSDVVRRDIRMSSGHPMAVGSEVRVGRVGWVTDILWIAVCYQGSNKGIVTIDVNSQVWKGIDVDEIDEIDKDDDHADSVPSTSTNRRRNTSTV